MSRLARMFAVLAVMAVTACGGARIDVSRMTTLAAEPQKATFVMVRTKAQDRSTDYPKLADQIAAQLVAKGFSRVESAAQARYALMFTYDGEGVGGDSGSKRRASKKNADEKIELSLSIALFDLTRPNQPDEKVFGGRARCLVEPTNPVAIGSALIEVVLRDFPGKSHETYSARLADVE